MKHRVSGQKFSRDHSARKALFKNLINSLVINGKIVTTEAKAKRARSLTEKFITTGKNNSLHSRRLIAAYLQNKTAVNKIVDELGPLFLNRPGGYTRIIRLNPRRGDNAPMARVELVEQPTPRPEKVKKEKPAKTVKKAVKTNAKKDKTSKTDKKTQK
jgi:large subunit ribosomal protein L17